MGERERDRNGDGRRILAAIKRRLRAQRMTYMHLARALGMSEAGIKKVLNADDISFNRLAAIARVLGLETETVIAEARRGKELRVHLSDEIQDYLLGHPDVATVFWLLYFEGRSVTELPAIAGFDEATVYSCLAALDSLGLIELHPHNRVVLLTGSTHITWEEQGAFITACTRKWSAELVDALVDAPGDRSFLSLRYLKLTRASVERLRATLAELDSRFTSLARSEMTTHDPRTLEPVCWLSAMEMRPMVSNFRGPLL